VTRSVYSANGRDFRETTLPLSACAPGGLSLYARASDPWVSFGPEGTAYAIGLGDDPGRNATGVAVATSYNGGRSWRNVTDLIDDPSAEFGDDKTSITADPVRAGTAYAVWDRLDFGPNGDGSKFTGPALLAVTHDSGRTWSSPVTVTPDTTVLDTDPNNGDVLRTGGLPSVAIDPRTGELYLTVEGTDFTGGAYGQIKLVHSTDGGATWSQPLRVNGAPQALAFTPAVAVSDNGVVAVTYYDIRTLPPNDTTTLPTTTWLATAPRGGEHFTERQIAPPFDLLTAPTAGGFFVGDYEGLPAVPAGIAVTPAPGHAAGSRPAAPHPGLAHGERRF
jgi:hypothetical protein